MPLDSKYPGSERPPKRALELEDSDVERAPASKRHRLPTPSTSDHRLDKTLASPSIVPTQPKPAASLKWLLEENGPDCAPTSLWPILNWLAAVPPHRTKSALGRLSGQRALATIDPDDYQHPSFEPCQYIPQSPPLDMPQSPG